MKSEEISSIEIDRTSSILNIKQCQRLFTLLDSPIVISSQNSLPTVTVVPWRFLMRLKFESEQRGLNLHDIRLTGGAASFVLDPNGDLAYRDVDFFLSINEISSESTWSQLQQAVFAALTIPNDTTHHCTSFYTEKIIRILTDQDRWALISLRNADGRNLELKFVEQMKRQYQFSVDSFQILLDPLLNRQSSSSSISFANLIVLSSYGNYFEALEDLHHRLIAVKAPEELRGGGLLKYCDLLARGFRPRHQCQMKDLQRYMCSRFFIDFRHLSTQERVLIKYVTSHFPMDYHVRIRFLRCLYEIISNDSIWLSAFERLAFLRMISTLMPWKTMTNDLIPSVPSSTQIIPRSISIEQIDIFVEIVNSLRSELFPKLNHFLSSM